MLGGIGKGVYVLMMGLDLERLVLGGGPLECVTHKLRHGELKSLQCDAKGM